MITQSEREKQRKKKGKSGREIKKRRRV